MTFDLFVLSLAGYDPNVSTSHPEVIVFFWVGFTFLGGAVAPYSDGIWKRQHECACRALLYRLHP